MDIRSLFSSTAVVLLVSAPLKAQITLVERMSPRCVIVVEDGGDSLSLRALRELRDYIGHISGATLLCSIECNRSRPRPADPSSAQFRQDVVDCCRLTQ